MTAAVVASACARAATVNVLCIDGTAVQGRVAGMVDKGPLRLLQGENTIAIPLESLLQVDVSGEPSASRPSETGEMIYLHSGGRLKGKLTGQAEGGVQVDLGIAGKVVLPFRQLAGIRFADNASAVEARQLFEESLAARFADQDVLVLVQDGKARTFRGTVESLSADGGRFRYEDRTLSLKPELLHGVVFAAGVTNSQPPPVRVGLIPGSQLDGWVQEADDRTLVIRTEFSPGVRVSWTDVKCLSFRSDRVVFLSDLKPLAYHFEPFFNVQWPCRLGEAVGGGAIRLDGRTFAKGVGMHSAARLSFKVEPGFRKLVGLVGIDDSVRPRGEVTFRVTADGREVFNSGPVRGEDAARPVAVELGHAGTVELIVDFAGGLDVGDHADWADIRFVK